MKDSYFLSEPDPNPLKVSPVIRIFAFLSPDWSAPVDIDPNFPQLPQFPHFSRYMLNRIEVARGTPKHQGWGTRLMMQICQEADEENVELILGVSPDDLNDFDWLVDFYKKFGFTTFLKDRPLDQYYNVMIRYPNHSTIKRQ